MGNRIGRAQRAEPPQPAPPTAAAAQPRGRAGVAGVGDGLEGGQEGPSVVRWITRFMEGFAFVGGYLFHPFRVIIWYLSWGNWLTTDKWFHAGVADIYQRGVDGEIVGFEALRVMRTYFRKHRHVANRMLARIKVDNSDECGSRAKRIATMLEKVQRLNVDEVIDAFIREVGPIPKEAPLEGFSGLQNWAGSVRVRTLGDEGGPPGEDAPQRGRFRQYAYNVWWYIKTSTFGYYQWRRRNSRLQLLNRLRDACENDRMWNREMNTFDGRRGEYIRDAFWRLALAQGETDLRVAMDAFQERSNLFINGAEVKTQGLLASMFERMIAETERKLS